MSNVQQDIRDWLRQQQDWFQQAAEQLLSSDNPGDVNIQVITDRLKTPDGQQKTTHRKFNTLTESPSSSAAELRLAAIGYITGIENLAPQRPLEFGSGNLVVVYGHNGSGKSGFTRILKRVCGKPRAAELKSNVYESPPAKRECRVEYQLAGEIRSVVWQPDDAPIDDLRSVDIFDSQEASFYLSSKTEASYTPPFIALFEELASVCDLVRGKLQEEQDRLVSRLPDLPETYALTEAGHAYRSLRRDFSEGAVQRLTEFSEADQAALDELNARLAAVDPAASADEKRRREQELRGFIGQLDTAASAVSSQAVQVIRHLYEDARTKRQIATESSFAESAHLEGVGSTAWSLLWDAAREYSRTAYPGRDYPVTDEARCVLCQQDLPPEARQRLRDFEAFVRGAAEAHAREADHAYQKAINDLPQIPTEANIVTQCAAAGLTGNELLDTLRTFWSMVADAREQLRNGDHGTSAAAPVTKLRDELVSQLTLQVEELACAAQQDADDAAALDRDKANRDKLNLEARRWIASQARAVQDEIARQRKVKEYDEWKKSANSRFVSNKIRQITEKVITQAYVDRFNRELKALSAQHIRVELVKAGATKGKMLHQLRLKGVQTDQDLPASVLSEGERRIVALAAFLASLVEKPQATPFIFDDPISSLDQHFESHVARRLAELAKSRQVLVFTHRLSLYGAMQDAATKVGPAGNKEYLQQRHIESFSGVAGQPADEAVRNANTKKANNILLNRLDDARTAGQEHGADAYRIQAQGICTEFRILLERTVEDDLLNQVVRRHRRSVTTDNRLGSLAHISDADCRFIDALMTKYSTYEHSQSAETPISLPEEPELRADLESLAGWREEFKRRAKA
ncbi:MAG: AAA family ATPase [Gemmatimonadota bacterium]|nr:AAA family ATPase [Gemmatimonadota bacterium]